MNLFDERLPTEFWAKVVPEPNSGCWLWTGHATAAGYGVWKQKYTHRLSCAAVSGPIPRGHHVDHLCRTPLCCNPAHLEAVLPAVNCQRGMRGSLRKRCKYGHAYTPENTWRHADGNRYCRTCKLTRNRERSRRPEVKAVVRAQGIAKRLAARTVTP